MRVVTRLKCMDPNPHSPATTSQRRASAFPEPVRATSAPNTKHDIGFAASMLGCGLIVIIAFIYFVRSSPGQDPTLDGTEHFAEELGHGFVGLMLILAGLIASLVLGGVGACLGSKAGKALLSLGLIFAILLGCLATVSYYARHGGYQSREPETRIERIGR